MKNGLGNREGVRTGPRSGSKKKKGSPAQYLEGKELSKSTGCTHFRLRHYHEVRPRDDQGNAHSDGANLGVGCHPVLPVRYPSNT